jgi:hypothetical protein
MLNLAISIFFDHSHATRSELRLMEHRLRDHPIRHTPSPAVAPDEKSWPSCLQMTFP